MVVYFYSIEYETNRVLEETAQQVPQNASVHAATIKFTILCIHGGQ
jgi:hypothetical protein